MSLLSKRVQVQSLYPIQLYDICRSVEEFFTYLSLIFSSSCHLTNAQFSGMVSTHNWYGKVHVL